MESKGALYMVLLPIIQGNAEESEPDCIILVHGIDHGTP